MDNLLLFTPSRMAHTAKFEDLLIVLFKNSFKISLEKCQFIQDKNTVHGKHYIYKGQKSLHYTIKQ